MIQSHQLLSCLIYVFITFFLSKLCIISGWNNISDTSEYTSFKTYFSSSDSQWSVLKRIVSVSIEACKVECKHRSYMCEGVAYMRRSLVCILLSTSFETSIKKQRGVILVSRFDHWYDGTAVTGRTEMTECGLFDSVFDISGNIYEVGSILKVNGKTNGIDLLLICDDTGQWEKTREGGAFYASTISLDGDCSDVTGPSGIYWAARTNRPIFCDMDTKDGPWMVFQRREDGSVDFYRNWANYTTGFGSVGGEFWMGLQPLHELLNAKLYKLRIDMVAFNGSKGFASYNYFTISGPEDQYRLTVAGFAGNVGDSFTKHSSKSFTTLDRDHDLDPNRNCAHAFSGAWWYEKCHKSNLNGLYSDCGSKCPYGKTINWYTWTGHNATLKWTEMKIRNS